MGSSTGLVLPSVPLPSLFALHSGPASLWFVMARHHALFIISEKMASIRRILQTGQTGNLANAPYQQPRRVTLKHFCLLLRCDDGFEKEPGNWLLSSYFYPTFVFSCRSVKLLQTISSLMTDEISCDRWHAFAGSLGSYRKF